MEMLEFFKLLNEARLERLYLFHGREELLKREAVGRIKDLLVPPGLEDFNLTVLEGTKITAQEIASAVETLPFMGSKRLVLVKDINLSSTGRDRISQEELNRLREYLVDVPDYSCVIFTTRNSIDMRTRLIKIIKEKGAVVNFDRLKPLHFEKWVKKQIQNRGKKINRLELKKFIECTGYLDKNSGKSLEDVENEINKLVEYCRNRDVITEDDIEAVATKNLETNIFKLVDAIGSKDASRALRLLHDMKVAGEPALKVLFMVVRQFRLLLRTACLKDMGYSEKGMGGRIGVQPFVAHSLVKQAANFTVKDLRDALRACSYWDMEIKRGRVDPWLALELFIAQVGRKDNKKSVL